MINFAKFSIEKNRIVLSVLAVVMIMGMVFYQSLSRDSMPPFTVRVATIVASFPGASPDRVEELVTDKIEKIAQELPELKKVTSDSRTGLSVVTVELKMDVAPEDLQPVWDRLRRKLDQMSDLPSNVYPQLQDDGIGEVFGIAVGITSDGFSYADVKKYADRLRNDLISLEDAAKVEINGEQEERVFIKFDNAKLKNYGLTSSSLEQMISSTNILNTGGEINLQNERIVLEPSGNFNNIKDIRNMLIPVGNNGNVISLSDVATIEKGYIYPQKQIVKINGKKGVSLHISLKEGRNILNLGQEVDQVLAQYQEELPIGLEVMRLSSLDHYIEHKVTDFEGNLIQSVVIVLAVMLIFLGMRTGLVIASLIPMVTIATFMVMGLFDLGINQISLAALIMALGMMVDNGIVVAESIMVKMEEGIDVKKAAIDSVQELFYPLLISTLTTSAAFLSFYMAESIMGDIMGPIFSVITIALISSWLISLSIISLLCVYFLKVQPKGEAKKKFLDRMIDALKSGYHKVIMISLKYKKSVVVSVAMMFIASLLGFGLLEVLFFPDSDRNMITIDINLPQGSRIEATQKVVGELETFFNEELMVGEDKQDGITSWTSFIGEGPSSYDLGYTPDEPNANYAHILINTSDQLINNELIKKIDEYSFLTFPDADVKVGLLGAGSGGAPIEIKVSGNNPDQLQNIAANIRKELSSVEGTKNVKDDWGPKGKKFVIEIDQSKAQAAGMTNQDIAVSLQTILDGFRTGEFREEEKSIPILLQSIESSDLSLSALKTANVYSQNSGKSVPLNQVAEIVPVWQYTQIKRENLKRTITVECELTEEGNANNIMATIQPWLDQDQENWGAGYTYSLGGDAEESAENMGAVFTYLPLSAFIIVMLLVMQFNSFRKMTIILLTIPLGVIGMVIGLLIFQVPFGFMAFLGIISLAGIVINNAIVLIERIEVEEKELKKAPLQAVIDACLQRFRPIILATFTTVLGLIPLYLGGGAIWEPMAVTIMVGLMFGTIITLIFIPALYSILFKVK
ncbi:efflux RND transporter permease subunit [Flammeovirga yaeyamensis]|uniref:Efflux RND transporter permease subunit n=1 Tax=Flammeovirga yaeyamensis TaxID=367791 RepID=A0AAX1N927_9BACT|nr:efflux RND transporter permease subunit [Flammeovirga yaeyamensis]MBB3699527.1 multidrug efflux pump subunit AcrB [Flammeovirga yaeyamensis]QWG04079.1 efflux RND transporter permease subunit [Flammeovirga yaeyamensis]